MPQQYLPDTIGAMTNAFAQGRELRKDRQQAQRAEQVRALAPGIMGGDVGAYGQAAALDPKAAEEYAKSGDRIGAVVNNVARQIKAMHDAGRKEQAAYLYNQALPTLKARFPNAPDDYLQAMPAVEAVIAQTAQIKKAGDTPAQQQYAEWLLANSPEGERDQVMGVLAGYKPRPSGAAIAYKVITGGDGVDRLVAADPRDPKAVFFNPDGTPANAPGGGPAGSPAGPATTFESSGMQVNIDPSLPQEVQAAIRANPDGYGSAPSGATAQIGPQPTGQPGVNPFASRAKEQQDYLSEQAKQQAQIDSLPERQAIETQGKVDEIRAETAIKPTKAQEAVDTQYGKDYVEFISGGAADANKALTELSGVIQQIENGDNLTGPGLGLLPNSIKTRTHPSAMAAQETVESTVQRSLRVILGAQFTEKEGERLIARAYNPSLDEKVNLKRVKLLFQQLQAGFQNKAAAARYFEEKGTLRGFTGKQPSWDDFGQGDAPASNAIQSSSDPFGIL